MISRPHILLSLVLLIFVIILEFYGCRKSVNPKVLTIDTNIPELEAKTAPVGEPDTTVKWISDTVEFLIKMWENRFGRRDFRSLIEALKTEKNPDYKEELILELGCSYDPDVIRPLIEILQNDKSSSIRATVLHALGNLALGNYGAFGEKYKPDFVRKKFGEDRLKEILSSKEKLILPALKNALHDKDILVVFAAASELVTLDDTSRTTLGVLLNIFRRKNIKKWKIQFIPSPDISADANQILKDKLERSKAELPERALEVLKKVKNKFVVDGLTEALEDEDPWVKVNAKQVIEEIKTREKK